MKKSYLFPPFFHFFHFVQKMKKKIEKSHTYRPIFHNFILIRKMKKWQVLNQWSVPVILHLTKNADFESEKCLKIKVFLCVLHSKPKKWLFKFHSPLWKSEKSAPFSHKKPDLFRSFLRYKVNQFSGVIVTSHHS